GGYEVRRGIWMQIRTRKMDSRHTHRSGFIQRVIAILSVFALSLGLGAISATAANAATPGVKIDLLHNGVVLKDGDIVPEGDELTLRVQYDGKEDIAGKELIINLPDSVNVS